MKQQKTGANHDLFAYPAVRNDEEQVNALVVTCSESIFLSALVNELAPRCVLQNLGGTLPAQVHDTADGGKFDMDWTTVEYALGTQRLKHVVLCGHAACCVPAMWLRGEWGPPPIPEAVTGRDARLPGYLKCPEDLPAAKRISQLWLAEQMARLDEYLAERNGGVRVDAAVHALWCDDCDGRVRIFLYRPVERQFIVVKDPSGKTVSRLLGIG